jgi:hypothetical protein
VVFSTRQTHIRGYTFLQHFPCPSSSPEFKAVVKLVVETWRANLVGQGSDASGLKHSNLRVTKVERVENSERFKAYMSYRQDICGRLVKAGYRRYVSIKDIDTNGSEGEVLTSQIRTQSSTGLMKLVEMILMSDTRLWLL